MTEHELAESKNQLSDTATYYRCGEQCLEASRELSIGLDDIEESILFLHEENTINDLIDISDGMPVTKARLL